MSDTLITIVAIVLAAVLMFIFPLMTISDRSDDVSQLAVKSATTDFVDTARTKGQITSEDYDKYIETITSTGNTYDVEIEVQVSDTNLKKRGTLVADDMVGENESYTVYTSQIMQELEEPGGSGVYKLKEGDMLSVSVKNTNQTISQQLKNFFYTIAGNDAYTVAAQHSGLVTANGGR